MDHADRTHGLGPTRARVLAALQDSGEALSVGEVAVRVGVHANSVRFHLDALEEAGLVERHREERRTPGRPRLMFVASPGAPDVADRRYRLLSEMLSDVLAASVADVADQAERVGRAWAQGLPLRTPPRDRPDEGGDRRHPVEEPTDGLATLVSTLGSVGFDSHVVDDAAGLRVEIGHCPFLEVADKHRDVVCPMHLGLMRGVLDRTGSSTSVADLHPLVEPSRCLAHLTR